MKAMVSALMPMSPLKGSPPLPSYIIPFQIIMSYCFFCVQEANRITTEKMVYIFFHDEGYIYFFKLNVYEVSINFFRSFFGIHQMTN